MEVTPLGYGPATPEDLKLDREAETLLEGSLKATQAAAADWAKTIAGLTGLLGVLTLVKGREDITELVLPARVLVGLFLLAGLLFAGRAIMLAALASEGTPRSWWVVGRRLKNRYRSERKLAAQQLLQSRADTVAAAALLIVAVGIAWYGPTDAADPEPPMVLITLRDDAPICGELVLTAAGLSARSAEASVFVGNGNVRSLNVVSQCPD